MQVLYVCTANICRSASAQLLLREAVAGEPELAGIEVRSAGTAAIDGAPGCAVAPALVGHANEHQSQPLTPELLVWADLILPAARDHRRAILEMDPNSRTRTFTVRQAGRIADWLVASGMVAAAREKGQEPEPAEGWAERFLPGDPRQDVQAMPDDLAQRWDWLVGEMDAARGLAGLPGGAEPAPAGPWRRFRIGRSERSTGQADGAFRQSRDSSTPESDLEARGPSQSHPDDIPDPHVMGMGLHALAYEQIASSTDALVRLLREVASPT